MPNGALGLGGGDWLQLYLAALILAGIFIWRTRMRNWLIRLGSRTQLALCSLFFLPIVLRLLLLPHHPVPTPDVYDEFSHLLVADTLLHFRLANPVHPMHRFFETFFVLQKPSYSSIYPLGQGLILAFGRLLSGLPWTGVLITMGAFCAACYWALLGYVEPGWAFVGGLLAVIQFGPLNLWANCYWGGELPAFAGCLVFGALPRLARAWRSGSRGGTPDAILLGLGFSLHMLTRQFESLLLACSIVLFCLPHLRRWRPLLHSFAIVSLAVSPAVLLVLLQNKAVTQHWLLLPEQLSQYQYGVPTTLTIQPPATPHVALTPQQALEYKAQALMHGADNGDTLRRFLLRLEYRVRYYRFFFLPPLYLAVLVFLYTLKDRVFVGWWIVATLAIFVFGTNLFPYLLVHYLAAVTCLFLLVAVYGLRRITALTVRQEAVGKQVAALLLLLCGAQFLLWYSIHLMEGRGVPLELLRFETWDSINHRNPERRLAVARQLSSIPGKLLVFVHYEPRHVFQQEWVWNAANIDAARIVFARDLGSREDASLIRYYPDRKVYLLEPDLSAPRLTAQQK